MRLSKWKSMSGTAVEATLLDPASAADLPTFEFADLPTSAQFERGKTVTAAFPQF